MEVDDNGSETMLITHREKYRLVFQVLVSQVCISPDDALIVRNEYTEILLLYIL